MKWAFDYLHQLYDGLKLKCIVYKQTLYFWYFIQWLFLDWVKKKPQKNNNH